jgi:hypothetical protein
MRRHLPVFIVITLTLLACQFLFPTPAAPTAVPASPIPQPAASPPASSATPQPAPLPVPLATLPPGAFSVRVHPDGTLYVGDQVSFEIIAPQGSGLRGHKVELHADTPGRPVLGSGSFDSFGIGGRLQATLLWAWDTQNLPAGEHTLSFTVLPGGPAITQTFHLAPASDLPLAEQGARWASVQTQYCILYYITGTAAERDLPRLRQSFDQQAEDVSRRFNAQFSKPIPVVLMPRVLGQGGFTSQEIAISYLDRNYAGSSADIVVHHEMVHFLDGELGGDLRPTFLLEGLAVYLSGGHFKPEALLPRAAALVDMGWYLPMVPLADNFYASQHEIGYLEAAALIEYLVDRWGWPAFNAFYRDIHPDPSGSQAKAIDTALQKHFSLSFTQLEDQFIQSLDSQEVTSAVSDDVRQTVNFYDTVRRYQKELDPSAYFETAWLADAQQMRQRNIVADYLRHPSAPENLALETMLVSADAHLRAGGLSQTDRLVQAAQAVLDAISRGAPQPFQAAPLAADYYAIVQASAAQGYQPQRIEVTGNMARLQATAAGPDLIELDLARTPSGWRIGTVGLFPLPGREWKADDLAANSLRRFPWPGQARCRTFIPLAPYPASPDEQTLICKRAFSGVSVV